MALEILSFFIPFLLRFTPVWSFLIYFIKINGKEWFCLFEISSFCLAIYFLVQPFSQQNITPYLYLYTFFCMIYVAILSYRFGFSNFNNVISASIWVVFAASEFWELPSFLFKIPIVIQQSRLIIHLYDGFYVFSLLFVVFLTLYKTSMFRLTKKTFLMFVISFLFSTFYFRPVARVFTLAIFTYLPTFNLKIDVKNHGATTHT